MSVGVATDARDLAADRPGGGPRGRSPLLWARLRALVDAAPGAEPSAVLDCGGGSGSLAVPLAERGVWVTVVDTSIDALATLLRRAAEAGASERVSAVQGEVESLVELLPSARFDLVLAHELLESLPAPAEALCQVASVLHPGGVVSIVIANPVAIVLGRVLAGDVAGAFAAFDRPAERAYQLDSLLGDCQQAGLSVESIEGIGVFTELVPGIDLERPGALQVLGELEAAAAGTSPYRDIASRLHVLARRPDPDDG